MTLILGGRYKYKASDPGFQKEFDKIWSIKAELIKKIMVKHPDQNESLLGFKTPEQLKKILKEK